MYKNNISNSNKIRIYSAPPYSIGASSAALTRILPKVDNNCQELKRFLSEQGTKTSCPHLFMSMVHPCRHFLSKFRGAEQLQTYMQFDRLVIFVYLHPSIIHPFPAVRILYNDSAAQKDAERSFDNETGLHLSHRRAISL